MFNSPNQGGSSPKRCVRMIDTETQKSHQINQPTLFERDVLIKKKTPPRFFFGGELFSAKNLRNKMRSWKASLFPRQALFFGWLFHTITKHFRSLKWRYSAYVRDNPPQKMAENQVLSETLHFLLLSWNSWRSQAGRWAIHQGAVGSWSKLKGLKKNLSKNKDWYYWFPGGRNPKHHGMYKTLEIMGYVTYQLVQGFFNQQYYVKNIYDCMCMQSSCLHLTTF